MNGAESLLRTLVNEGVEICFMNPGTSEMQFVAAVDRVPGMRCVLGLFEGVVSGAADGYARMKGKPASTLLHLGPGLANALANFHNARRARSPVVNIIGEHATYHRECDPPLYSDIEGLAAYVTGWVRTVESAADIPAATRDAVSASLAPPGQIATLIIPADCSWSESSAPEPRSSRSPAISGLDEPAVQRSLDLLRSGEPVAIILNGSALHGEGLRLAARISENSGARIFCDCFVPRIQRGAGRPAVTNIPYLPDMALKLLAPFRHAILVGAQEPVGFFAYPGVPNRYLPAECEIITAVQPDADPIRALAAIVDGLGSGNGEPAVQEFHTTPLPAGELTVQAMDQALAALIPENSIIVDEAVTGSIGLLAATARSRPHDWLFNTGGALGLGMPLATGAALACPGRRVLSLQADGSSMYSPQALWTQARESLDITTVIYANREYRILSMEHERVGAGPPGTKAAEMMSLSRPELDWVQLARGMGVPARRVTTADEFNQVLENYLHEPGPNLIETLVKPLQI